MLIAQQFKNEISYDIGGCSLFFLFYDPWCYGHSLIDILGQNCNVTFILSLDDGLHIIIINDNWVLPPNVAYMSISSAILASLLRDGPNRILWNGNVSLHSHAILESTHVGMNIDWAQDIWFKRHALNYSPILLDGF